MTKTGTPTAAVAITLTEPPPPRKALRSLPQLSAGDLHSRERGGSRLRMVKGLYTRDVPTVRVEDLGST